MRKWNFIFSIFICLTLIISYFNFQNREYNWDLPGYVGSLLVYNNGGYSDEIHQLTYGDIKKESSEKQFNKITGKGENTATRAFYNNSLAFEEQLPYYQVKLGYNLLIRVLYFSGFSAPLSVLFLNSFLFLFSVIIFYYTLKKIYPDNPFFVFGASVLFLSLPVLRYLATIASPDILMVFLMLIFGSFIITQKKSAYFYLLLFLIVISRPDYIVFALSYLFLKIIFEYYEAHNFNWRNVFFIILLMIVYFSIMKYYNYPSWKDVFYDSFINRRFFISKKSPDFDLGTYTNILLKAIINMKKVTLISLFFVCGIIFSSKNLWIKAISLILFLNIYLKFLFFPAAGEYRFFLPFILCLFLLFVVELRNNKFFRNKIL